MENQKIKLSFNRRFGVEIELNSFDLRDFTIWNLGKDELPDGIHYIGNLILKNLPGNKIKITTYDHNHNNLNWFLKPDSSCGIEICSPAYRSLSGLKDICKIVKVLGKEPKVFANEKCSLHVTIEALDCSEQQIANILGYWLKTESVFMDAIAPHRKINRYCYFMGLTDLVKAEEICPSHILINKFGTNKYGSVNTFHLVNRKRRTIEFRIMGREACLDSIYTKNWIRLLLHFFEIAKDSAPIRQYKEGDSWSSYCWLGPKETFKFLKFTDEYELSTGLIETRNWFIKQLLLNESKNEMVGYLSPLARAKSMQEVEELSNKYHIKI